jgi:3-oxoacyl-[acyl-carrier-protein] synthase-3
MGITARIWSWGRPVGDGNFDGVSETEGGRPVPLPVRIAATGLALPPGRVTSADLDARYDRPAGHTQARSGVTERRWAEPAVTTSELAAAAVTNALTGAGWHVEDLDALIVTSAVPEQPMPTTAVLTLAALGHPGGAITALDVNATCLSFLNGLQAAAFGIACGQWRRVALVSAELASRGLNHDDVESSAIFGDGAAAALLEPAGDSGSALLTTRFETHPSGARLCEIPAGGTRFNHFAPPPQESDYLFRMDGGGVMRLAARHLPDFAAAVLGDAGLAPADLEVVVPHQASGLGMRYVKERLGFEPERVVDILPTRGNQVAASLPSALHEAITSGRLSRGGHALLIGTGAGLVIGAAVLRY